MPVRGARFAFVAALGLALAGGAEACGAEGREQPTGATTSTSEAAASSTTGGVGGAGAGSTTGAGGAGGEGGQVMTNNGFPAAWPDGTACGAEADVFVWEYDPDTFILRQSLCTNFEGPFLYLFFGEDKALLEDTGSGDADVAGAVLLVVSSWLQKKGKSSIELIVAHSHGHGDHVGGDGQFDGIPNVTVVGKSSSAVEDFFGLSRWPEGVVPYDLGGRVLDVIAIPGHQSAHIAFYDRRQRLLLTGDTLYPGRLYIEDWTSYGASVSRLRSFVAAGNTVDWVLGTHIEMKAAGGDFAFGADQHPGEHALELPLSTLDELGAAIDAMGPNPQYEAHAEFIIYPL